MGSDQITKQPNACANRRKKGKSKKEQRNKFKNFRNRRSVRYSIIERDHEEIVAQAHRNAKDKNGDLIFSKVIRHEAFSPEDRDGKDITVWRNGQEVL